MRHCAPAGVVAGRYELVHELGRGGMATVMQAIDRDTRRVVAVKLALRDGHTRSSDTLRAIHNEVAILSLVAGLRVPRVFDSGDDPRFGPYVVMERLYGRSVADWIGERRLSPRDLIDVLGELLRAIGDIHDRDVVHGDLKPSNLFLMGTETTSRSGGEHLAILDFGLATSTRHWPSFVVRSGVGTPGYIAPERLRGIIDRRGDLYSIAAIAISAMGAYDLDELAGDPPRAASWLTAQGVPDALSTALGEALRPDYRARPTDARSMLCAIAAGIDSISRGPSNEATLDRGGHPVSA